MEPVSDFVNGVVKEKFRLSFGHFISLSDLILTHDEIDQMVDFTRTSVPQIWKLVQDLLGYSDAYKKKDSTTMFAAKQHLAGKTYSRNTFYQIVALTRMRNGKHFSYWASIGTAAAYATSSETSAQIPSFFGLIASRTTLSRNWRQFSMTDVLYKTISTTLKGCIIRYQDTSMDTLHEVYFFIAVFNNSQKNVPFKFQRFGATSHFVKVASRMFLLAWQGPWRDCIVPVGKVSLTYIDQKIPPPFGTPAFEMKPATTYELLGSHASTKVALDEYYNDSLTFSNDMPSW
jgi:hypothetical protein